MKTAEEKAKAILMEYKHDNKTGANLGQLIVRLLKEQDRDTRHACAEAILALPGEFLEGETVNYLVDRDSAHAACMNVRAL